MAAAQQPNQDLGEFLRLLGRSGEAGVGPAAGLCAAGGGGGGAPATLAPAGQQQALAGTWTAQLGIPVPLYPFSGGVGGAGAQANAPGAGADAGAVVQGWRQQQVQAAALQQQQASGYQQQLLFAQAQQQLGLGHPASAGQPTGQAQPSITGFDHSPFTLQQIQQLQQQQQQRGGGPPPPPLAGAVAPRGGLLSATSGPLKTAASGDAPGQAGPQYMVPIAAGGWDLGVPAGLIPPPAVAAPATLQAAATAAAGAAAAGQPQPKRKGRRPADPSTLTEKQLRAREAQRRFREKQKRTMIETAATVESMAAELEHLTVANESQRLKREVYEKMLLTKEEDLGVLQRVAEVAPPPKYTVPPALVEVMQTYGVTVIYNPNLLLSYAVAGYSEHMDPASGMVKEAPPFDKVVEDWQDIVDSMTRMVAVGLHGGRELAGRQAAASSARAPAGAADARRAGLSPEAAAEERRREEHAAAKEAAAAAAMWRQNWQREEVQREREAIAAQHSVRQSRPHEFQELPQTQQLPPQQPQQQQQQPQPPQRPQLHERASAPAANGHTAAGAAASSSSGSVAGGARGQRAATSAGSAGGGSSRGGGGTSSSSARIPDPVATTHSHVTVFHELAKAAPEEELVEDPAMGVVLAHALSESAAHSRTSWATLEHGEIKCCCMSIEYGGQLYHYTGSQFRECAKLLRRMGTMMWQQGIVAPENIMRLATIRVDTGQIAPVLRERAAAVDRLKEAYAAQEENKALAASHEGGNSTRAYMEALMAMEEATATMMQTVQAEHAAYFAMLSGVFRVLDFPVQKMQLCILSMPYFPQARGALGSQELPAFQLLGAAAAMELGIDPRELEAQGAGEGAEQEGSAEDSGSGEGGMETQEEGRGGGGGGAAGEAGDADAAAAGS
eukprot:scaffold12.g7938.t1